MRDFLQHRNQDLEKKALMDLLNDADSERFKKLVASSVKQMQLQRSGDTHQSLNGEVKKLIVCFFTTEG